MVSVLCAALDDTMRASLMSINRSDQSLTIRNCVHFIIENRV